MPPEPSRQELKDLLDLALEVAFAGAEVATSHYRRAPAATRKTDGTWVSEADRDAEARMREILARQIPEHNVLGEEEGLRAANGGPPTEGRPTWVLDPIDGTNNYLAGVPVWATLVGLRLADEYVLGAVHAPALRETYDAARGLGARCNGDAITVSTVSSLAQATVVTPGYEGFDEQGLGDFYFRLVRRAWRSRGFGDFWGHVLVARGACEVMVDPVVATWDLAALIPIVEEAGGRISTETGAAPGHQRPLISTNGLLHQEVLGLV